MKRLYEHNIEKKGKITEKIKKTKRKKKPQMWISKRRSTPTLRKESREPFSMYSVMIITGLPGKTKRNH